MAADLVVPITYRKGSGGQHSQNLRMYKQEPHNRTARRNLTALFAYFCLHHINCVKAAADVDRFTHVCFVPSTKNPSQDVHPLEETLGDKVRSLRDIRLSVNQQVPSESRSFHKDWFEVGVIPEQGSQTAVLLLDDTWVTGARAQSAAYCLKQAGAHKVVVLVLARQINPDYGHSKPLVERISKAPYEMDSCAFHLSDMIPAPRSP